MEYHVSIHGNDQLKGTAEHRIIYRTAGDGEVVITGAERITNWKSEGDNVWSTEVLNSIFSVRNPFEVELGGDWLFDGPFPIHLGDVYWSYNNKNLGHIWRKGSSKGKCRN